MLVTLKKAGSLRYDNGDTGDNVNGKRLFFAIIQIHPVPLGNKVGAEESGPCASSDRKSKIYHFLQKNVKFGHFTLFVC